MISSTDSNSVVPCDIASINMGTSSDESGTVRYCPKLGQRYVNSDSVFAW